MLRRRIHAAAALLLAASLPCAVAQTAQHIPIESPKPKPAEPAKQVTLEAPKPKAPEPPKEVDMEAPKTRELTPTEAKDITEGPPPDDGPPVRSFAPQPKPDTSLEQQIRSSGATRTVTLYAWQLNTAKAVAIDADQTVKTADGIRLGLLWEVLRQVALGDATWDETIAPSLTLREATQRAALANDTSAQAALIKRLTTRRLEDDLHALGQPVDWLAHHEAAATPHQMVLLLQHIGMCDLDLPKQLHVNANRSAAACRVALDMLRGHIFLSAPVMAEDNSMRSGIVLIAAKSGPIAVAVYGNADSITAITQTIVDAWSPAGLDSTIFDKPHLGVSWD